MDNLKRSNDLLKSAKDLLEKEDYAGVSGLAYQAVESAIIALTEKVNGKDKMGHYSRRKRAQEILNLSKETLNKLWSSRNIDFYGNEKIGEEKKELNTEDIKESVNKAEEIIGKVENELKDEKAKTKDNENTVPNQ